MNILILCPFAAVRDYLYPLVALGRDLKALGHRITFVHCHRAMASGCTAMNAVGVPDDAKEEEKRKICDRCLSYTKAAESLHAWEVRWLVLNKARKLSRLSPSESAYLKKVAAYELLLQFKCETLRKTSHLKSLINKRAFALMQLWPQAKKIIQERKYNAIICYNSLYGAHRLFWKIASNEKIPFLSIHHSHNAARDNEFTLVKNDIFLFLRNLQKELSKLPLPSSIQIKAVYEHDQAMQASRKIWSYSSAKKDRAPKTSFIKFKKKVLVCLSSPDEVLAAQHIEVLPKGHNLHVFRDQIDWLKWIKSLAKQYPKVLFWIRPHPRLYPNKREGKVSEIAKRLEKAQKSKAPANFFWPESHEQGSVWHHLENTDVLFNGWSSLADDFGKIKIPVLTFFPEFSNSGHEVDLTAATAKEYAKIFKKIIQRPEKYSKSEAHNKWRAYFLCANTFKLDLKRNPLIRFMGKFAVSKSRDVWNLRALLYPMKIGFFWHKDSQLEGILHKIINDPESSVSE